MNYERIQLAENIGYSEIIDSKFKTGVLQINFITELSPVSASLNALSLFTASMTNSKYPDIADFSARLDELYGSEIFANIHITGDCQVGTMGAVWLDNKYALDEEEIELEVIKILFDCIFAPDVKDGKFNEKSFSIVKKDILSKIEAEINNKRRYAVRKASQIAYKDEPAQYSAYGTKETVMNVNEEDAYNGFLELIKNAQIEIYYVASQKNDSVKELVSDVFKSIQNTGNTYEFINFSPAKNQPERVSEVLDVNQSKMVLVFKSENEDKYAMKFLSALYGETPFSKLFANVREKMSLCYYCASGYTRTKNTIIVDCGVENKNIEIAEKEILNQLDEIKKGNFSDEDMNNVLLSFANSLNAIGDTIGSYINWYNSAFIGKELLTPEETLEKYKSVTKERIIKSAESLILDTVYVMKSKESF